MALSFTLCDLYASQRQVQSSIIQHFVTQSEMVPLQNKV
jgi:hypothetical protein